MRLNSLMKNPLLAIGILMMVILLFQLNKKGFFESRRAKLTPSSCKAVQVKLDRRIPENWKTHCEGQSFNNLAILIKLSLKKKFKEKNDLKAYLYREMANNLIHIAKNSPDDNLERTDIVRLKIIHPQIEINAISEGRFIVKLATLKDKRLIAQHLQTTVQVQERMK